jgi:hypothetical protein
LAPSPTLQLTVGPVCLPVRAQAHHLLFPTPYLPSISTSSRLFAPSCNRSKEVRRPCSHTTNLVDQSRNVLGPLVAAAFFMNCDNVSASVCCFEPA